MPRVANASTLRSGDVVGEYRLVREIGRGAMAVVFEASGPSGRNVAVKALLPEIEDHADIVERFEREGRILQALRHENIARVFGVGTLPNGTLYLVIELLEGEDLRGMLETSGPLSIAAALRYVLGACRGVAEAHSQGIVHRDLKPANLFLAKDPRGRRVMKVLDFGVAKIVGGVESMTGARELIGSLHYVAPEQLVSSKAVRPQSDVWALGVVLYELLTDTHPFDGANVALLCAAIRNHTARPIRAVRPDCPLALEDVVRRCLSKDPAARFATAGDLADALERIGVGIARTSVPQVLAADADDETDDDKTLLHEPGTRLIPIARLLQQRSALASLTGSKRPSTSPPGGPSKRRGGAPTARSLRGALILAAAAAAAAALLLGGMWVWARTVRGLRWRSAQTVTLHVTTEPAGASFAVDYGSKMTTPGDVSLAKDERSHVLLIWKDGYRPESRQVTAVADATLDVPLVSARP